MNKTKGKAYGKGQILEYQRSNKFLLLKYFQLWRKFLYYNVNQRKTENKTTNFELKYIYKIF